MLCGGVDSRGATPGSQGAAAGTKIDVIGGATSGMRATSPPYKEATASCGAIAIPAVSSNGKWWRYRIRYATRAIAHQPQCKQLASSLEHLLGIRQKWTAAP